MTDIAARLRILDELYAEAKRVWPDIPADQNERGMLMLACDRIAACEPRGFARRRPAQPAALDVTKLQVGLLE